MKRKIVGIAVATLFIVTAALPVIETISIDKTKNVNLYKNQDCIQNEKINEDNRGEPWSLKQDIFSVERNENLEKENTLSKINQNRDSISIEITKPKQGYFYFNDREITSLNFVTLIIGSINVQVNVESDNEISRVLFYIDDMLECVDSEEPFLWECDINIILSNKLKVVAFDNKSNSASDEIQAFFFNLGAPSKPDVKINEIMFNPVGSDNSKEWIELYNNGTRQNIKNWVLTNRTGVVAASLPEWDFPNGAYLVVYFGLGINDNDFSNGNGSFYTDLEEEIFNNMEDECALYTDIPSESTILDFVSWCFNGDYNPGHAHDYAVNVGIWSRGDFLDIYTDNPWVFVGATVARDRYSTDTDVSFNWDKQSGLDSIKPTPGMVNLMQLRFAEYGSETANPNDIRGTGTIESEWTVLFYLNGDNDLQDCYDSVLEDLRYVESEGNVNIVVMYDRFNSKGINGDPRVRWYYLLHRRNLSWNEICHPGEKNMGDPQTLVDFVNIAMEKFPAKKYALSITGHSAGWKGCSYDETSGDDGIFMKELLNAFVRIYPGKVNLLIFEGCLMGMLEVFYQVEEYVDFCVACEDACIDTYHLQHKKSLRSLKKNPKMKPGDFAKMLVANSEEYCERFKDEDSSMSAIDLSKIDALVSAVSEFAIQLKDGIEDYGKGFTDHYIIEDNVQINIKEQMRSTIHFYWPDYIDLYDFAEKIGNDGSIIDRWKSKYSDVMKKIKDSQEDKAVIAHHGKGNGISIYFPTAQADNTLKKLNGKEERPFDDPWPSYLPDNSVYALYAEDKTSAWGAVPDDHPYPETPDFYFCKEFKWDEFLHRYYKPVADAGENLIVSVGEEFELKAIGSSDSDGIIKRYIWDFYWGANTDSKDWDKDGFDEFNDDNNKEGAIVKWTYNWPGDYIVTLTVWDSHQDYEGEEHYKTDQDEVLIRVIASDGFPPTTIKHIGEPNWEDGYIVTADTPIWLNATDPEPGSGIYYIHYEVWQDDILIGSEDVSGDSVEMTFGIYEVVPGIAELRWYAVDNAENMEEMHYQEHLVYR